MLSISLNELDLEDVKRKLLQLVIIYNLFCTLLDLVY